MAKVKSSGTSSTKLRMRPALTPEGRETQMISLAMDAAEQQLLDGTASSQVITHFLKLGSMREQLETERLRKENNLLEAKTKAIAATEDAKILLEKALRAFTEYSGEARSDDDY